MMMGAAQLDIFGNQNISRIGANEPPKAMLIGCRGAPGNTLAHRTSYWIPKQSARVLVQAVDFVCGVGNDRAAALAPHSRRYHDLHRVVTDRAVFGFGGDGKMALRSVHPGFSVADVQAACGFALAAQTAPISRHPTDAEMAFIAELDPQELRYDEVPD
jgi:acyl CoA:acetate/3-ketoacid CoA transferase beta subunit